jgi:serine/threonine-protein kinase
MSAASDAPVTSDKRPTVVDAHRRYARLAVAWYDADAAKVEAILHEVHARQERGEAVHILELLVAERLLTDAQAEALRLGQAPLKAPEPPSKRSKLASTEVGAPIVMIEGATLNGEPAQMGPYRILRRLGQGGMGAVYLAFDAKQNRQVAVKVLAAEQAPKSNILRRFQLEGKTGALLTHPNIVRSYDVGQDEASGLHYIVLEYVDGPTAHELLDLKGKLEVADAVHIILDIARALEHAHKNRIIHRDVKPANILLASSGLAKLSDFGLAKHLTPPSPPFQGGEGGGNLTHATQGIGTPYYMPYEQAMNAKMADERSDIYSLGATLYHLIAGDVPFSGESSLEIVEKKQLGHYPPAFTHNANVPTVLEEILFRMLRRDPGDRYQTISEVIVDLERAKLAAPIPSYVLLDNALQDPVMRQRLTKPVEPTRPDLRVQQALEAKQAKAHPAWLLRYRDGQGNLCKAKVTREEIFERLQAGTIPLDAEATDMPQSKFRPLAAWPAFAGAIAALRPQPAVERAAWPHWWLLAAGALGIGTLALLATTVYLVATLP